MEYIYDVLRKLGADRRYKGFKQIAYLLECSLSCENEKTQTAQLLYRDTALHFNCSDSAVEHNIRTLSCRAWKVNPALLTAMCGYPLSDTPTSTEFIKILTSYLQRNSE